MTRFSVSYFTPEEREARALKAFRFLWQVLCWVTAFSAVVVATVIFMR